MGDRPTASPLFTQDSTTQKMPTSIYPSIHPSSRIRTQVFELFKTRIALDCAASGIV